MARYTVTTFDVCASGMERLRNRDEFILCASIDEGTRASDLSEQWLDDIQAVMREDSFDYDAARECVSDYVREVVQPLFAARRNPFNLEPGRDDIGFDEGCTAFLFIRDNAEV